MHGGTHPPRAKWRIVSIARSDLGFPVVWPVDWLHRRTSEWLGTDGLWRVIEWLGGSIASQQTSLRKKSNHGVLGAKGISASQGQINSALLRGAVWWRCSLCVVAGWSAARASTVAFDLGIATRSEMKAALTAGKQRRLKRDAMVVEPENGEEQAASDQFARVRAADRWFLDQDDIFQYSVSYPGDFTRQGPVLMTPSPPGKRCTSATSRSQP